MIRMAYALTGISAGKALVLAAAMFSGTFFFFDSCAQTAEGDSAIRYNREAKEKIEELLRKLIIISESEQIARGKATALERHNQSLSDSMSILRTERDTLLYRMEELGSSLKKITALYSVSRFNQEVLASDIGILLDSISTLRVIYREREKKWASDSSSAVAALSEMKEKLRATDSEKITILENISRMQQDLAEVIKSDSACSGQLSAVKAELSAIRLATTASDDSMITVLAELQKQRDDLQASLKRSEAEAQKQRLKKEQAASESSDALRKASAGLSSCKDSVDQLRAAMVDCQTKTSHFLVELNALQAAGALKKDSLRVQNSYLSAEITALTKSAEEKEKQIARLKAENESFRAKGENEQGKAASLAACRDSLQKARQTVSALEKDNVLLQRELEKSANSGPTLNEQVSLLQEENRKLRSDIASLEKRSDALRTEPEKQEAALAEENRALRKETSTDSAKAMETAGSPQESQTDSLLADIHRKAEDLKLAHEQNRLLMDRLERAKASEKSKTDSLHDLLRKVGLNSSDRETQHARAADSLKSANDKLHKQLEALATGNDQLQKELARSKQSEMQVADSLMALRKEKGAQSDITGQKIPALEKALRIEKERCRELMEKAGRDSLLVAKLPELQAKLKKLEHADAEKLKAEDKCAYEMTQLQFEVTRLREEKESITARLNAMRTAVESSSSEEKRALERLPELEKLYREEQIARKSAEIFAEEMKEIALQESDARKELQKQIESLKNR